MLQKKILALIKQGEDKIFKIVVPVTKSNYPASYPASTPQDERTKQKKEKSG